MYQLPVAMHQSGREILSSGDKESVIVLPAELANEIADEAVEMTAFEDFVTEKVKSGQSIIGLYPATHEKTRQDFVAWRKRNS